MVLQARCPDPATVDGTVATGAGRSRDRVVRGLLREWNELDRGSYGMGAGGPYAVDRASGEPSDATTAGAAVVSWGRRHPAALAGCRTLTDVLDRIVADPDATLLALLAELATGDELAGRVVVQTMLPKLRAFARRDPDHDVADYVSWCWLRARNYPTNRRRQRVAANLALDTLKSAKRSLRTAEEPWEADGEIGLDRLATEDRLRAELDHHEDVITLTAARVLRAARRLGLVDEATGLVLESVYIEGLPGDQAADRHGMTVATLRWRCSKAVRRLAAHAEALREAA